MFFDDPANRERDGSSLVRRFVNDWLWFFFVWIPPLMLVIVFALEEFSSAADFFTDYLVSLVIAESVMTVCLAGAYAVTYVEALIFDMRGQEYPGRSDTVNIIRSMVFVLPGMYVAFHLAAWLTPFFGVEFTIPPWHNYRRGFLISAFSVFSYVALDLFLAKRRQERRLLSLEKENLQSKVQALSAQMNPHLLFNALNSVAATIKDDPEAAEEMTVELAGLYRKILKASKVDLHTLGDEIDICQTYLEVEKSRFGDRLGFVIDISEEIRDKAVPSLILQPVVENAVKHGIAPVPAGGFVAIRGKDRRGVIVLRVDDTGIGFGNSSVSGCGTALENCRNRLRMTFGSRAGLRVKAEKQGTSVEISIPMGV